MRKKAPSHCTIGDNALRCLHCGVAEPLPVPMSIRVAIAMTEDFQDAHTGCRPSERGAARMRFTTPQEWLASWDTGMSSKTIWYVMMGKPLGPSASIPHDPSDFGRCHRLLKAFPQWRERLTAMDKVPGWAPLVSAWPILEALYDEEAPTGSCPKLFAEIQRLREEGKTP